MYASCGAGPQRRFKHKDLRSKVGMLSVTLRATLAFALAANFAPAAASAQSKPLPYIVNGDVVQARVCVARVIFNPGDMVAFRADVKNLSGVRLTADEIKARGITAVVTLKDGTKNPVALQHPSAIPECPGDRILLRRVI